MGAYHPRFAHHRAPYVLDVFMVGADRPESHFRVALSIRSKKILGKEGNAHEIMSCIFAYWFYCP